MLLLLLRIPIDKHLELVINVFKSIFTEEEIRVLVEEQMKDLKTFRSGIIKLSLERLPPELYKVTLVDDLMGPPSEPPIEPGLFDDTENYKKIILGSYLPMHSQGVITFYQKNIESYCGSLINIAMREGFHCNLANSLFSIFYLVETTWLHECFHYYCDYKRSFTKSLANRNLEEAFAVAHSRLEINRSFPRFEFCFTDIINIFGNQQMTLDIEQRRSLRNYLSSLERSLQGRVFSDFRSPGYRDWIRYNRLSFYEMELYDYLKDNHLENLKANNFIPVNEFIRHEIYFLKDKGADLIISIV